MSSGKIVVRRMSKKREAELLNNQKLREVERFMGHSNTTYSNSLENAGRFFLGVKFKGVFPSDKIPQLNDLSPYCILNLDRSGEPGSHWIALAKTATGALVYDSFGRDHRRIIPNLRFSGNGRIINTERDKEQSKRQYNCGQRCISFLTVFDEYGDSVAKWI